MLVTNLAICFCQEEEKGIEMSDNFDGKLQDVDPKGDDDEEEDENEDDNKDAEKEMGDTEKDAEQLDQQVDKFSHFNLCF